MDPANLNNSAPSTTNSATSPDAPMHPSADQFIQLSTAITGALLPCNLLNKILGDIIGLIPQPQSQNGTICEPSFIFFMILGSIFN